MYKYAIIDVETTGGVARYERITEIAIVVHDGNAIVEQFATLLNPERSIPWNITQLTGISDEMVADAPKFYEVAKKIVELTEDAVFVAHNVSFDYHFVREEFARLGYTFTRKQLCTVRMARAAFPGLPSYSLSNLKRHFGIIAERSHRALDDTLATVSIFERILASQQGAGSVNKSLREAVKASKLPSGITLERLQAVPEACGVYYLHDANGDVLYVGKSLNIRKRLFEHFADQTPKGEKLRAGVCDIGFDITGSEMVALLLESAEIKRLQPPVNRAQRRRQFNGAIYTYTDEAGYIRLAVGKKSTRNTQKLQEIADYPKVDSARAHLLSLVRQFELCYRLCHLDASERACFHYGIKQCKGACIGVEAPDTYNERVEAAFGQLRKRLSGSFLLVDQGRSADELAIAGVQDGKYLGFCFKNQELGAMLSVEAVLEDLKTPYPDPDADRIIQSFLSGNKNVRIVRYT